MNKGQPPRLRRGSIPLLKNLTLLPENDPLLSTKIPDFDFDNDPRNPAAMAELIIGALDVFGGVGLSANQVGVNCRIFAMKTKTTSMVFFNPVITDLSTTTAVMDEGCVTFPDLWLKVSRPDACRIIYNDIHGVRKSMVLDGINSRIAMHEHDHLNGILMPTKVSRLKLGMARKRQSKQKKV